MKIQDAICSTKGASRGHLPLAQQLAGNVAAACEYRDRATVVQVRALLLEVLYEWEDEEEQERGAFYFGSKEVTP